MPPTQGRPRKGSKFMDVKLFIAALALAVTLGVWNLLSAGNLQTVKTPAEPASAPPPQANAQDSAELGPIPTLVPLVTVETTVDEPAQSSPANNAVSSNPSTASLRSVTAPSETIVQKSKPRVEIPQVVVISEAASSSSSGSGGSPAAVTTTRSS